MTTSNNRPLVLAKLRDAYSKLRTELAASLADRHCDTDAPWTQWRAGIDALEVPEDEAPGLILIQASELAGVSAARALRAHLAVLARAYWPDIDDPADDPIDHPAIYPPARSALEAAAVVCWALDPDLDTASRTQRGAELLLWSQWARRRPEAGWQDTAKAAGLDVRGTRRNPDAYAVHVDGQRSELTLSRMVRSAFGEDVVALYGEWSGVTHPDPLALSEGSVLVPRPGGMGDIRIFREDEDVAVGGHVAEFVGVTIDGQARYWGRHTAPAVVALQIASELREFLPEVAAAVNQRNSAGVE